MGRACRCRWSSRRSPFQLGYTRTTEAYLESALSPGFYSDVAWMHHYDAVFASYYFQPQQEWGQGNTAAVAPSWREAAASLVARGIEEGSAVLARQIREAVRYDDPADRDARNAWCTEHGMSYDGFDGTYLDGDAWTDEELDVLEPLAPTMTSITTSPLVSTTLSQLRLLGVRVSVSPAYGVSVTVG